MITMILIYIDAAIRAASREAAPGRFPAGGCSHFTPRPQLLEGTKGGPKEWGSYVTTALIVFYFQCFTCSSPHVDRFLGTPLVTLKQLSACFPRQPRAKLPRCS